MSVNNGVVAAPIGLKEIADLIEESSYDVGTVCNSQKVNMWSLYRPIFHEAVGIIGDGEREAERWGYKFDIVTTLGLLKPAAWETTRPGNGWKRLTDFEGYNHKAYKFIPTLTDQTSSVDGNRFQISITDAIISSGGLDKANISLGTLGGNLIYLKDCYLGVRMRRKDSNTYYYSTDRWNNRKGLFFDLTMMTSHIPARAGETWLALLFASAEPVDSQNQRAGLFAVLDQAKEVEITFLTAAEARKYTISIQLEQSTDRRTYSGNIVFRLGNTTNTYNFNNIALTLYNKETYGYNPVVGWTYDNVVTIGPGNTTVTIPVQNITTSTILNDPYFRLVAYSINESKQINSGYQQAMTHWEGGNIN